MYITAFFSFFNSLSINIFDIKKCARSPNRLIVLLFLFQEHNLSRLIEKKLKGYTFKAGSNGMFWRA